MPLTLDELDAHLFECADIIRDAVDPTDYKEYILPLVFYKAISDEYEQERAEIVAEYGEDFADNATLYDVPTVPEGHRFADLRTESENVDEAINNAFTEFTQANPDLSGIFNANFMEAGGLTDDRLSKLIEHLSTYDLDRDSVPPDMLGEAYMDLVRHFAEEEGKSGGQFFTPPHIVQLCVRLVDDFADGMTFHDPTSGSGGMLTEAAKYYREEQGGDPSKLRFTGQEINPDIAAIARMNLSLHTLNGDIERGDSLADPKFTDGDALERFDRVLANFPFSANWAKDDLQDDQFGRFDWHTKLPRADRGDYAFIMHIAEQLTDPDRGDASGGKAAIVIPHGVLFRKHEQRYRQPMLENDLVEAIVGLPENLFQNNSIPSAILVLNTDKPAERAGQVQFIHAADEAFYEELSNQNELTDEGLDHIVANFDDWTTEERVSRTVGIDEIEENDFNLNIALYVDTTEPEEEIDVSEELGKLRELQAEREEIESRMTEHMEALQYE